jgi:hypothetical protein
MSSGGSSGSDREESSEPREVAGAAPRPAINAPVTKTSADFDTPSCFPDIEVTVPPLAMTAAFKKPTPAEIPAAE